MDESEVVLEMKSDNSSSASKYSVTEDTSTHEPPPTYMATPITSYESPPTYMATPNTSAYEAPPTYMATPGSSYYFFIKFCSKSR